MKSLLGISIGIIMNRKNKIKLADMFKFMHETERFFYEQNIHFPNNIYYNSKIFQQLNLSAISLLRVKYENGEKDGVEKEMK